MKSESSWISSPACFICCKGSELATQLHHEYSINMAESSKPTEFGGGDGLAGTVADTAVGTSEKLLGFLNLG